jgi:hypothetical protein
MKVTRWAILKVALIVFFTIAVAGYRVESFADAWGLGVAVAMVFSFVAFFQLVWWLFYDMVTLKRGGWAAPLFGRSPFASRPGPFFHLEVEAVALLTFGAAKAVSAVFQGPASLVLGGWLLAIGAFLLAWQRTLRRLFRHRFAGWNGEQGAAPNGGPVTPLGNSGAVEGPPSVS